MSGYYILSAIVFLGIALPVLVYCVRLRPEIEREQIPEIVLGAMSAVFMFVPFGMVIPLSMDAFVIGMIVTGTLLVVHWAFWLTASIRRKPAGKVTRLSPVLPLLVWTNCSMSAIAWFFIIPYAIRVMIEPKKYE